MDVRPATTPASRSPASPSRQNPPTTFPRRLSAKAVTRRATSPVRRHGDEYTGISSGCTTCHAAGATGTAFFGVTPLPQGSGHIPTNADCVSCHASTSKFRSRHANEPHAGGGNAVRDLPRTGKSFTGVAIVTRPTAAQDAAHPPTGDCGTCHSSTTSFTTGVTGKPANHIPTIQACTLCHTSLPGSYKPGVMNHSGISSGCTTCHAAGGTGQAFFGVTPLPQGSGHIPTNADCVCDWPPGRSKFGPGTPMNSTPVAGTPCATCHETGQELHRRSHRHPADGGTGCGTSADRRLRYLP